MPARTDVVEGLESLLDGGVRVPAVDLVEVDVVGAEAAEAVVDLGHDGLARQAHGVAALAHRAPELGGDDDLVAVGHVGQGPPDDLLAGAVGVDVGGVEEVDAGVEGLGDEGPAGLLVEAPLVGAAVGDAVAHAAEADLGDLEAGGTQSSVPHGVLPR